MASVPSIPPLLCSTPPPIEFCENDEDSGLSPTLTLEDEDDVFGEYTSRNERLTPDVTSLPLTPVQNELSSSTTSGFTEVPPTIFDDHQVESKVPVVEAFNYTIDKEEQPEKVEEEEELENNNKVILEDIPDDSDNELYATCSKNFDDTLDVNSKEFFEIQVIDDRGIIEKVEKEEEEEKIAAANDNHDVAVDEDEDDNDDFAEFSTFERAVEPIREVINLRENETSEFMFEADFSAFATTTTNDSKNEISTPQIKNVVVAENKTVSVAVNEFDDDDDDEFGDFAEAVVLPAVAEVQSIPAVNLSNLNERLKSMLQIMFPIDIDVDVEPNALEEMSTLKRLDVQQKLELPPIDAAKALDYQYAGSQMRHALIKSIGIDYRNMLYGEKWNPTMPRFAANLSCNPLQPLKPQNVSQAGSDHVTNDVPAVDFDWNSSGLVNPLDGSKEVLQSRETETHETLQQPTDDATEQKQQQQIQIESCNNNNNNTDTTTTDTAFTTTTTTTLSTIIIPTDNNIQQLNNNQPTWETEQTLNYKPESSVENESAAVWSPTQDNLDVEDEVVTTSTYAGPLKETHIYTPPRGSESSLPRTLRAGYMTTPTTPINHNINLRADPIDFDYEKAAAGIIIDETVVKKEYRDVEYNPDFGNAALAEVTPACDDDFTEFQSVPPIQPNVTKPIILNSPVMQAKRTATPTIFSDEMILSPAILLPQAVPMNNNNNNNNNNELNNNMKTKIEWGDTVSSINPEELARIEELFPQTKSQNSSSQKSTPTHQSVHNSPQTISAAIAQKEQIGLDEDEWSDFVSVTIPKPTSPTETFPKIKQQQQQIMLNSNNNNNNNDDDWSDFVSNTATTYSTQATTARLQNASGAQFNSAAWQTANFYNNPLSFYHQSQQQTTVPSMHKVQNNHNRNINNINNNNNNNFIPQQIHIMQDFSTAPPNMQQYQRQQQLQQQSNINNNNQYQVGSAKVAPSISLIPDLGFVAPAMPTHTAYVNALPKSSFSMKK